MANGAALETLLEPESVPDDLYGTMLEIFFTGLRTMVEQPGQTVGLPAAAPS